MNSLVEYSQLLKQIDIETGKNGGWLKPSALI